MPDNAADFPAGLEPKDVFAKFFELTRIPRGSGNEKGVSDYLKKWAESKGFPVRQDGQHSLLITKPGVKCAPGAPAVIVQGHLDMVCNAAAGYAFDFEKEPIKVVVDGDRLRADRTTLGADDGIGVAYALALLDSTDVPHPPLEVVLTTGEETGMYGASDFDVSWLKGETFINIDSEEEGIYYASCAGGARIDMSFPVATLAAAEAPGADGLEWATIKVSGLRGGHSGVEIDKGRGNSHRLMARILRKMVDSHEGVWLADVRGGTADNAIPTETTAVVMIPKADREAIKSELAAWQKTFRDELKGTDGKPDANGKTYDVVVEMSGQGGAERVLEREAFEKVLFALLVIPTGVDAMDFNNSMEFIPESSSNMAIVLIADGKATVRTSIRSQLESKKELLRLRLYSIGRILGAEMGVDGDYPGWEYNPKSEVRDLLVGAYERQTGKKATVRGVHAGLECGLFAAKAEKLGKKMDFASIGPDLREVHTPVENLGIASTGRTWELIKEVLAALAKKGS